MCSPDGLTDVDTDPLPVDKLMICLFLTIILALRGPDPFIVILVDENPPEPTLEEDDENCDPVGDCQEDPGHW